MKRLLERGVLVSSMPLALALAALFVRESVREPPRPPSTPGRVTEFTPPPLLLGAAAAPGADARWSVDGERSSARWITRVSGGEDVEQGLRVTGNLRILADHSLADVELDLVPRPGKRSLGQPGDLLLHLRGVSARSRATAVPGVRACDLRCSALLGGRPQDVLLSVTWMRLPGDTVEMQATARLEQAPFDLPEPWWRWMLPRETSCVLGIHLTLRTIR